MFKKALLTLGLVAGLAGTARAAIVSPTLSVRLHARSFAIAAARDEFQWAADPVRYRDSDGGLIGVEAVSLGGGYAELDTWARAAIAALLAGRPLVIETLGSGSAYRIYAIGVGQ
jgi:hypothetical protein